MSNDDGVRGRILSCAAWAAVTLVVAPALLAIRSRDQPLWLQAFVVILCGFAVFLAALLWGTVSRDTSEIRESRESVRAAERSLEEALRGEEPPRTAFVPVPAGELQGERLADGVTEADVRAALTLASGNLARLTLPELWAVTHRRLDLYHDIATGQAKRSFRNAQYAMVIGFALLVAFVAVALKSSTTAGAVVAGGLGAVSAALAGFVSRTFVRSQEAAAAHLRAYFDQPLEFARYLAAERIIRDSDLDQEQRAEALTALVQAMVAGPSGAAKAGDGEGGPSGA